jgi:hypothetical protein
MININDIKEGDTIVFRNGGRVKLGDRSHTDNVMAFLNVCNGFNSLFIKSSGFDIVEIIPAPKPIPIELYFGVTEDCFVSDFSNYKFGSNEYSKKFKITITENNEYIERIK